MQTAVVTLRRTDTKNKDTWLDTLIMLLAFALIGTSVGVAIGFCTPQIQVCAAKILSALTYGVSLRWIPPNADPAQAFAMVALVYLCNWWVTHPVVPAKRQ